MATEQVFDLTGFSSRDYRNGRATRWELGFFAVALGLTVVLASAYQFITGTFQASLRVTYGLSYVLPAVGSVICWFTDARMGPGAERLVVNQVGVRFLFPSGREFAASWSDPSSWLTLTDYRRHPLARRYGFLFFARPRGFPQSPLSEEAYSAIISTAREIDWRLLMPDEIA